MLLRTKKNVKGGQKFNGVEVVSIITWCWSFGTLLFSRSRHRFHLSVTSERVGGLVGWVRVFSQRSFIPGKNIHSSMALLTALLTHGICFFFTYFSFYYQCLEKIIFILTVSLCKFTVINATQISKFERECSSSNNPLTPQGFFLFPSSFPHKR